jgi:hypothetical protein
MTQQEIMNHQLNNPIRSDVRAQRQIPRLYRNETTPYKGLMNPIPIHRMRDPDTGILYNKQDLEPYETSNYKYEMKMIKRKGKWGNQKAKNGFGYTSMRDTKQFYELSREKRLDTFWARHPSWDVRFEKKWRLHGKRKMFHVHRGYFDKDFQMPWRFWTIHSDVTIEEANLMHPDPCNRFVAPKNSRLISNWNHEELFTYQKDRRYIRCSHLNLYQNWRTMRPFEYGRAVPGAADVDLRQPVTAWKK